MSDEQNVLALLQRIAEKVDAQGVKLDAQGERLDALAKEQAEMRSEQRAMRSEMNTRFERVTNRLDNLTTLANRAAARADDSLSAQARSKTELAAIREHLENGDRKLVREFQDDMSALQDRVDALEQKQ